MIQVLDLSELVAQALSFRQKTHPDCYEAKIYGGKIALGKAKTGHLYVVCSEGVGYVVSKEEPLEIEFHGSYYKRIGQDWVNQAGDFIQAEIDPHSHSFDYMPFAEVTLSVEDLKSYPILGEVDLADHVRSFGNRLEDNFWGMYEALTYNEFAASRRF
jgi:hypothetical protein